MNMNKSFPTCVAVGILMGFGWYFGMAHWFDSAVNFATAGITGNRQSAIWLVSGLLAIGALIQITNLVLGRKIHKK